MKNEVVGFIVCNIMILTIFGIKHFLGFETAMIVALGTIIGTIAVRNKE